MTREESGNGRGWREKRVSHNDTLDRDGSLTSLGDETFQPFTNLSIRWILNSELANKIWVIYIDTSSGKSMVLSQ